MSEKNSLSRLFEVVAESYPSIEFKGFTFKVRKITQSTNALAAVYTIEDAKAILKDLPEQVKNEPIEDNDLKQWIEFSTRGNVEVIEIFGLNKVQTKGDLEVCKIAIKTLASYVYAMCLLNEDGTTFGRDEVTKLADLIQTQPEFFNMIDATIAEINGQVSPNDQPPLVKP